MINYRVQTPFLCKCAKYVYNLLTLNIACVPIVCARRQTAFKDQLLKKAEKKVSAAYHRTLRVPKLYSSLWMSTCELKYHNSRQQQMGAGLQTEAAAGWINKQKIQMPVRTYKQGQHNEAAPRLYGCNK